ncbi:MAG: HAMP domain-containing protein, partial [bacterium]|nr:HAMP domain-containing protein [bacterium]
MQAEEINFSRDLPYSSTSPGILENASRHYKQYIHYRMLPLAMVVILATLVILTVFPLFFKNNLVQPLKNLLEGMKKVKQGELDTTVPVRFDDEIGFLTDSFNHMVLSLKQSVKSL